jgi:hypothetical protein
MGPTQEWRFFWNGSGVLFSSLLKIVLTIFGAVSRKKIALSGFKIVSIYSLVNINRKKELIVAELDFRYF